jgi:hypothetical protein
MHEDLARVRDRKPLNGDGRARKRWLPIAAVLVAAGSTIAWWAGGHLPVVPAGVGSVLLETEPPGFMVHIDSFDKRVITTGEKPSILSEVPAGIHKGHVLGASKFDNADFEFTVAAGRETRVPKIVLQRSKGMAVINSVPPGCEFELRDGDRVEKTGQAPMNFEFPTGEYEVVFRHRGREKKVPLLVERGRENTAGVEFGTRIVKVRSIPPGAEIFCDGESMGKTPRDIPMLEGMHKLVARYAPWPDDSREIVIGEGEAEAVAIAFPTGSVKITTKPAGAEVFAGDEKVGETTGGALLLEGMPPGEVAYTLKLAGYKPKQVKVTIVPRRTAFEPVEFEARPGPRRGEPWTNSLGMNFVPVGDLLAGVWLVRVRDYAAYSAETGRTRLVTDFPQDENHPVARVNREDATAFCEWLTQHERTAGKLDEGQIYRLPTDAEWSLIAGMPEEAGDTPEKRDGMNRDFLWGTAWPPPQNAGNFADSSARQGAAARSRGGSIAGYIDGFAYTSPVGAFRANAFGLFDMSGNVWQWVGDSYNGSKKDWGVLRGGCWATAKQEELRLGYRNVVSRDERDVTFGFRCILVPGS